MTYRNSGFGRINRRHSHTPATPSRPRWANLREHTRQHGNKGGRATQPSPVQTDATNPSPSAGMDDSDRLNYSDE